jgi:serine protease Do
LLAAVWAGGCRETAPSRETPVVKAFRRTAPAVVNIRAETTTDLRSPFSQFSRDPLVDEFFQDFPGGPQPRGREASLGSGIIMEAGGLVLTNEHVILGATQIQVSLEDGREFEAELVGADPQTDLAVLHLKSGEDLPFVRPGRSDDLMIGEPVIAIGNPFGLGHTLTTGVISSLHRSVRSGNRVYSDLIQTDASINPGNSGGPLLNIRGELIGITTAIYQKAQGIGFAVPVDRARQVVDDLVRFGEVRPGWLGLEVSDLEPGLRDSFDYAGPGGVLVTLVNPGGPGAEAKVRVGDIIESVAGHPVADLAHYRQLLRSLTVGDRVTLRVFREGGFREASLAAGDFPLALADDLIWRRLGLRAREETGEGQPARSRVVVDRVEGSGPAGQIGLAPGDMVRRMNRTPVQTLDQFRQAFANSREQESVILLIQRGEYGYYITLPLQPGPESKG